MISVINKRAVVLVEVHREALAQGCAQPIAQLLVMYCFQKQQQQQPSQPKYLIVKEVIIILGYENVTTALVVI